MNIYLLYTGGTIGCVGSPLSPLPGPDTGGKLGFISLFKTNVESIITSQIPGATITYDYFSPTLDSTNMQPSDWVNIAQKILSNYTQNDAFLVLHGTDKGLPGLYAWRIDNDDTDHTKLVPRYTITKGMWKYARGVDAQL